MTQCFIDIETFSRADLRRTGAYRYAEDVSTQLLLVSYAFGATGEVKTWTPCLGEAMPDDLAAAFANPDQIFIAHNAAFERVLLSQLLDEKLRDPSRWRCTMALAYSLALPGSLDELCGVLGVADDKAKLKDGKRLVMKFCTPNRKGDQVKATDEMDAWMRFVEYSRLDVVANQEIAKRMARWALPEHEQKLWELDQQINDAGLPVDLELVDAALAVRALDEERGIARSKELTNLDNPNSRAQLLQYLQDSGLAIADLTKASVSEALRSDDLDPEIREVLELRRGLSKTSIKKFQALRDAVCADGRLRGTLQYAGAGRTWRWSGRLFQPQNLARPTLSDADIPVAIEAVKTHDEKCVRTMFSDTAGVLSSLIRPAIAAPAGQTLVSCDYSSIETVMLAWAARSPYLLELYASGRDPYIDFYSKRFGVPYDDVSKKQRTWAKPAVLGCGYMLGAKGLVAYAHGYGVPLSEEEAQAAVDTYRREYDDIPQFWWDLDRAARACINGRGEGSVGPFKFVMDGPFMQILLPSGRALSYLQPRIEERETPWGEMKPQITYLGRDTGKKMQRISTHPGKLCENIVQAIARDVLAFGLVWAASSGSRIVGHVHDEIIVQCPEETGEEELSKLTYLMGLRPQWCQDAPISAAGWVGNYYRKD